MKLFSLFKSASSSKATKKSLRKVGSICPVCKADIGVPTRKKKCPSCKSVVFARTTLDGTKVWLTNEQAEKLDNDREQERINNLFFNEIRSRATCTDNESLTNKASKLYISGKHDEAWSNLNSAILEISKNGGVHGNSDLGGAYSDVYLTMGNIVADEKKYKDALSHYFLAYYWDRASRLNLEVATGVDIRKLDFKQDLLDSSFFIGKLVVILERGKISQPGIKAVFLDVLKTQSRVAFAWLKNSAKQYDGKELDEQDLERYIGLNAAWQAVNQALSR